MNTEAIQSISGWPFCGFMLRCPEIVVHMYDLGQYLILGNSWEQEPLNNIRPEKGQIGGTPGFVK